MGQIAMGRRVLAFSSIGHALMHMMTAFYAVIVLTLAIAWGRSPESLLELYAPAAILLGIMSLPAGWAADRFGAPLMMVVMFVGLGASSIACGLVAEGDTFALALALCGLGVFGAIYHSAGIGRSPTLPCLICQASTAPTARQTMPGTMKAARQEASVISTPGTMP